MNITKKRHFNIPIFIPEAACPHQCIFCNQRSITEKIEQPSVDEVVVTVERYLATIPQGNEVEIAFFGGNFTGLPMAQQTAYLQSVQHFLREEKVASIRCSTRPDYIDDENVELLLSYGVKMVELGAQSFDEEVLKKSGRGHSIQDIDEAVRILKKHQMPFGLQMMTGLPGDTPEKSLATAAEIIRLGAENTRIYPCLVIRNTALEQLYQSGSYQPQSMEEAILLCSRLVQLFEANNVKILRVGLHRSDGFDSGKTLIDGPYHPSFNELVESHLWKMILEKNIDFHYTGNIIIIIPKGTSGLVSGHQKCNRKWLEQHFRSIQFMEDEHLKNRTCHVDYC